MSICAHGLSRRRRAGHGARTLTIVGRRADRLGDDRRHRPRRDGAGREPDGFDEKRCPRPVRSQAKAKYDRIADAAGDAGIRPDQASEMREALGHMEELDGRAARCEPGPRKRMEPCWDAARPPSQPPGVSELSATAILSEIGVDMCVFEDADQLRGWCGLVPGDNQSDGKKKSARTARAGQCLKPQPARCALAAVRPARQAVPKVILTHGAEWGRRRSPGRGARIGNPARD